MMDAKNLDRKKLLINLINDDGNWLKFNQSSTDISYAYRLLLEESQDEEYPYLKKSTVLDFNLYNYFKCELTLYEIRESRSDRISYYYKRKYLDLYDDYSKITSVKFFSPKTYFRLKKIKKRLDDEMVIRKRIKKNQEILDKIPISKKRDIKLKNLLNEK